MIVTPSTWRRIDIARVIIRCMKFDRWCVATSVCARVCDLHELRLLICSYVHVPAARLMPEAKRCTEPTQTAPSTHKLQVVYVQLANKVGHDIDDPRRRLEGE